MPKPAIPSKPQSTCNTAIQYFIQMESMAQDTVKEVATRTDELIKSFVDAGYGREAVLEDVKKNFPVCFAIWEIKNKTII